jgi:transposase
MAIWYSTSINTDPSFPSFHPSFHPPIKQFYEKKKTKTNGIIAIRAVAHKLARASYWIMKTDELFDMKRAF